MSIQLAEIISKTAAYGVLILSVAVIEQASRPAGQQASRPEYSLAKSWKDINFTNIS